MDKSYSLIKSSNHYIFKRLVYPRFETLIDLDSNPVIKEIRYFENCTATELEIVMKEVTAQFRHILLETY